MRLRPRQYVYIAVIVALGIYNGLRVYRARQAAAPVVQSTRAAGIPPAWTIFEDAVKMRDGVDGQFQTVLRALNEAIDGSNAVAVPPQTSPAELSDLKGCRTWLLFYRQEFLHPSANKPGWREQTLQHTLSCAKEHRDSAQ